MFLGFILEYGYSLVAAFIFSWIVLFSRGFDVIHSHNPPDIFVLIAAFFKPFGKRFVFDHHDLSPEMYYARFDDRGNRFVYQALLLFEKLSCKLADHVIATNESYKKIAIERNGVAESRVSVVRNGPDLNRLRLVEPDIELQQKAKIIIGYVGVMGFQDGVDYLLRALHHLANDLNRTDFYAVIIGTGDAWNDLRTLSGQLNLDNYVWFTGRVSDADLLRYLSTADICVDPDPYNPFNDKSTMIKMTEYLALQKPIVAFDLCEHRVTAQEAALYARPNDELDFARKIVELMDNSKRREQMGRMGRQRVETELAWSHQEQHLLQAYQIVTS